jgi:hypothetical protein
VPPEHLHAKKHDPRCPDDGSEREARDLHPRRHPREPRIDRLKLVLDDGEVGAGLIDLMQREDAFVCHDESCRRSWLTAS